jgi:putative acetyltransferase
VRIVAGRLDDPRVQALVALHQRLAREATAPGFAFALDLSGLRVPAIRFFSAWDDGEALLGVGALRRMTPDHGEVKSMHTAEPARRRGVGAAMLRHILAQARAMGMTRASLETGTSAYFAGAVALYLREGFVDCAPFGDYVASSENRFLTRQL